MVYVKVKREKERKLRTSNTFFEFWEVDTNHQGIEGSPAQITIKITPKITKNRALQIEPFL
jgi:hypothetical protein